MNWSAAVLILTIAMAACSRGDDRTASTLPPAVPVSLPDLSRDAPSVQEQIKQAYSELMRRVEDRSTPATELANAYGDLGMLLLAAEFGQAAESCLLNAQMLATYDMRWPYYLGHVYKDQGANAKASASFEQARRLQPDDVPTLIWLGETYLAENQLDPAESAFAKARRLEPRNVAAVAGLGRVLLARRNYTEAVKHLEEALALDRQPRVIHYSLAMAYRGAGDLAAAEAHLRLSGNGGEIAVRDPLMQEARRRLRSARSYETLGIQTLAEGDAQAAAAYFRKGLDLAPDSASLHHRLGTALYLAGDVEAGREQFDTALRLDPTLARAHYSLGVLLVSKGNYQQAAERLSAAVKYDTDYVDARLLLGELLRHTGRPAESLRHYGHVIKIDPRMAEARLGYAMALVSLGGYQQARDQLTDAINVYPDAPDLVQALARLLAAAPDARIRDGRRAVALMQRSPGLPRTPEQEETMAMAYAEAGDYQQAVARQRQAIAAAERANREAYVREAMAANLRLFEGGKPARIPWRDGTMP